MEVEENWNTLWTKSDAGKGLSENQTGSTCWISVAANKKSIKKKSLENFMELANKISSYNIEGCLCFTEERRN